MTNKNKNELVSSPDDETTSEMEVKALLQRMRREEPEIEVDAATFDINDRDSALSGRSHAELKAAFSEQSVTVENLDFENEQLRSRLRGLEEELKARAEISDELNATIRTAEAHLHDSRIEYAAQEKQRHALEAKIQAQSETIATLSREHKALQQSLATKADGIEELQAQVRHTDARLSDAAGEAAANIDQQKSLQLEVEDKQKRIEQITAQLHEFEQELKSRQQVTEDLESRLQHVEAELGNSRDLLAVQTKETQSSQLEVVGKQELIEQQNARQLKLEKELDAHAEKERQLEAGAKNAESQINDFVRQVADQENERHSLHREIEDKKEDITRLADRQQELEERLRAREVVEDELRVSLRDTEAQLLEAARKSAEQGEEKLALQANLKSKQEDIEVLHRERHDMEEELIARADTVNDLNSKILDTESRLRDSLRKVADQDEERQSLQLDLEAKQERVEEFNNKQRDLEKELKAREEIADELKSKVKDRELRLEDALKQLAAQDKERKSLQLELENKQKSVEQFTSRQHDLEEELKARAEIADELKAKIHDTESRLDESLKTIATQTREQQTLQKNLDSKRKSIEQLSEKSRKLESAATELRQKIRTLENNLQKKERQITSIEKSNQKKIKRIETLADRKHSKKQSRLSELLDGSRTEISELRTYIDGRKSEWAKLESGLTNATSQLSESREKVHDLTTELGSRNSQLVRSREQYILASEKLTKQKSQIRKLRVQARDLEHKLHDEANKEIEGCRKLIARQSGELDGQSHALDALKADRDRYLRYADSLRMQLQDQVSVSKVSVAMREKLEAGLDAAKETINELTEQFRSEQERASKLQEKNDSLKNKFDSEVQKIRFELGAAEETIAGHETINEQLVSDLVDNRSFQQALESQLGQVEKESSKSVAELNTQLEKAQREAEELERDLHNRDAVITELMRELSNHGDSIELGDSDKSLQKIEGSKPKDSRNQSDVDRDRVTRQLIGNADGRELRFPLFKNRLTIGRTGQNDIQLNMQYVSRRHAVVSTDHGQTRVIDWGSKNGVYVNNEQVSEKILHSGDRVMIGTTEFRYEERGKR